jgi:hypothetical protein
MIPSHINKKDILIPYLEKLGFSRITDDRYTFIGNGLVFVLTFYITKTDEEYLTGNSNSKNFYNFSDAIKNLNEDFKSEIRKIKIKKLLNDTK